VKKPVRECVIGRWHGEHLNTALRSTEPTGAGTPEPIRRSRSPAGAFTVRAQGIGGVRGNGTFLKQPRSGGTARPEAEGPERASAEPRKARSALAPDAPGLFFSIKGHP
jgi:hypothetical protein